MRLFHHKKIRDKILSIALVSNIALVAMIILSFLFFERFADSFRSFEAKELRLTSITSSVKNDIQVFHRLALSGTIVGFKSDPTLSKKLEEARAKSSSEVARLVAFAGKSNEPKLKEIAERISIRYNGFVQITNTLISGESKSKEDITDTLIGIEAVSKRMFDELDQLDGFAKKSLEIKSKSIEADAVDDKKTMFLIGGIGFVLSMILSFAYSQQILTSLRQIQNGIRDFSDYLLRRQKTISPISIKSDDEFAQMANMINENIFAIQDGLKKDAVLISEVSEVVMKVKNGFYSYKVNSSADNQMLEELK
ncbi:MAG: hypothetical protein PHE67_14265, partial [Campylobacterales bacterium]|nr:hypothetical protein [Campylobacterales bacterium]